MEKAENKYVEKMCKTPYTVENIGKYVKSTKEVCVVLNIYWLEVMLKDSEKKFTENYSKVQ